MKWCAVLAMVAGCIEPNLTECPGDYACAPGLVCDLAHHGCVDQDQLDKCAGSADLTPCATDTVSGECFDGVCLEPGCGNRVVELGEECDDGNHLPGDGCSLDCASTERCGNGVVDVAFGEACDDGNFVSHDGCSSVCGIETASWQAHPITMLLFNPNVATFDTGRHVIVYGGRHATWEWDGQAWRVASIAQSIGTWVSIVHDTELHRTIGFASTLTGKLVIAEWDGAAWTELAMGGPLPSVILAATYDPARHAIAAVGPTTMHYFDVATLTWRDPIPLTILGGVTAPRLVADEQRSVLVLLDPGSTSTWEYDGASWKTIGGRPPADGGWALAYDAVKHDVISVGGTKAGSFDTSVSTWDGSQWTVTAATVKPRANAFAWFDAPAVNVFSGTDTNGPINDFASVLGSTTTAPPQVNVQPGRLFYDSMRHRLLMFLGFQQWSWDGAWHEILGRPATAVDLFAYDPMRGAVVARTAVGTTWLFDDVWHQVAFGPGTVSNFPTLGTYDYVNRRVIVANDLNTLQLPSDGTSWASVISGGGGVPNPSSVAFDRGTGNVVALGASSNSGLADLTGGAWVQSLSPGTGYVVIGAFARASVMMVPTGAQRPVWERRNGTFATLGTMPAINYQISGSVEMGNGRVMLAGDDGDLAYLLEYRFGSITPDETCAPNDDADGDGLVACDDPDCWESCTPACPFATSCP